MNDQRALFHDAVSARARHRNDRHSRIDGHYHRPFLKTLEASIGTSRALGINQERLSSAKSFGGLFDANNGGVVLAAIHRYEMGGRKGLSNNRPLEEGLFQDDGDPAWNRADNRRRVRGTGMIRDKQAHAQRDPFDTQHSNPHANGSTKKQYRKSTV